MAETRFIECPDCSNIHGVSLTFGVIQIIDVFSNKQAVLDAVEEEKFNRDLPDEIKEKE